MCANLRYKGKDIYPGSALISYGMSGAQMKQFGIGFTRGFNFFTGNYNARIERLNDLWKNWDRCYVEATEFKEGNAFFYYPNQIMKLAAVQNEKGVLLLTKSSKGTPVELYHHRTAVILDPNKISEFYTHTRIVELNYSLLKLAI
jgi:hypothetical protein